MTKHSHRSSLFNIKADIVQSHGSYIFDLTRGRKVLDLFGMYSSLPLGYNHEAFGKYEFLHEVKTYASLKVANCEVATDAADSFIDLFTSHLSMRPFSHFHFCCTGALAIEAAVKTAMVARGNKRVATFESNFHGINGYGGMLASGLGPASMRLSDLPYGAVARVFPDPTDNADELLHAIEHQATRGELCAVLVEPIQCTVGDRVLDVEFLRELRSLCDEASIPLIFDEIQTGFGGAGTLWYFEQLGFVPDIVVFGKKTQVSGIMVSERYSAIFRQPSRLEVTFDGDVLDMIRAKAIMRAYERHNILRNVNERGAQLEDALMCTGLAVRRVGLLLALDFESRTMRDAFVKKLWEDESTIVIPTGDRSVRMRPSLAITEAEVLEASKRIGRTACAASLLTVTGS